ncbi:MAG: antibiotic biosynthesis monooxygenase [Deltaproteobacteria bacterium]|nr:antibiotic biosynthesis monooxygenase [Deltaproteobacteria bacterium]
MKVIPEKRLELSQAIVSLTDSIRAMKGCRSCDFCQSLENENELCLIEEWDTIENFRAYLKSELFKVLRGAMNLLEEPCDGMFYSVLHLEGIVELMDGFWQQKKSYNKPIYNKIYK